MKTLLLFLTTFLSVNAYSQQYNVGRAPFALLKSDFKCDEFIQSLDGVAYIHLSVLYETFGKNMECLSKVMKDPRFKTIQFHLFNEVCVRNGQCDPHESLYGYTLDSFRKAIAREDVSLIVKLQTVSAEVSTFLNDNLRSDQECYIDPLLETRTSASESKIVAKYLRGIFPRCAWVVHGHGVNGGGDVKEGHGSSVSLSPRCIANLDGQDIDFSIRKSFFKSKIAENKVPAYLKKYAYCDRVFLWSAEDNCITGTKYVPKFSRTCNNNGVFKAMANMIINAQGGYFTQPTPLPVPVPEPTSTPIEVGYDFMGNPLPEPWITKSIHDEIAKYPYEKCKGLPFEDKCYELYFNWISAGHTLKYMAERCK